MLLILMSGLALTGATIVLLARAFVMPRAKASETVGQISAYGFRGVASEAETNARGALAATASRIGTVIAGLFGELREAKLRNDLVAAGLYRTHARDFLGYRILAAIALPALFLSVARSSGAVPGFAAPVLLLLGAYGGWRLPMIYLHRRAKRRFAQVDYDLPELIDLLVVTIEAGLGFNRSLQLASERLTGPLGDELRLMLQEQRMGLSTLEALRNMLARCDTPMMRSFVRSVLQGEALGVSIGDIMRNLATDMRKRRRQAAEERAQKAPVKLLFPLIFLIFPAMFIVILGPAAFHVSRIFANL